MLVLSVDNRWTVDRSILLSPPRHLTPNLAFGTSKEHPKWSTINHQTDWSKGDIHHE